MADCFLLKYNFIFINTILCSLLFMMKGEVYTSSAHLKQLIQNAKRFPKLIEKYLKAEGKRLEQIRHLGNNFKQLKILDIKDADMFLNDPLNIYSLVKQISLHTSPIISLMDKPPMSDLLYDFQEDVFPRQIDLRGVEMALSRLIKTYQLPISQIAKGIITQDFKSDTKLSALDCYQVGLNLFLKEHFYEAVPWFEESFNLQGNEKNKTINKRYILKRLSFSLYQAGNLSQAIAVTESWINTYPKSKEAKQYFLYLKNVSTEIIQPKIYSGSGEILDEEGKEIWNRYYALCRNEKLITPKTESKLSCYYFTNNAPQLIIQPIKAEDAFLGPHVIVYHDILNNNEINELKRMAIPELIRSQLGKVDESLSDQYRISKVAWLSNGHPTINKINLRLEAITGLSIRMASEPLQINDYGIGGHYEPHYDFLRPNLMSGSLKHMGNRIATVLFYMNDVIAGGATAFLGLNISVRPKKGSAVFWYNLNEYGDRDYRTQHASCPVLIGNKWVANKWIRSHPQTFTKPCPISSQSYLFDEDEYEYE